MFMTKRSDVTPLEIHRFPEDGAAVSVELIHQEPNSGDFATMARDIDQFKRGGAVLDASKVRFRNVFEKANFGIAIASTSGILLDANESMAQLLGFTRQELIGTNIGLFTHPDDFVVESVYLKEIQIGERDDYRMNKRYLTRQGTLIWVDLLVIAVPDANGNGIEAIGLIIDITERLRVEAELRIAAIAFESHESMILTDAKAVILKVNKAFTRNTGYSAAEVVGQTPKLLQSGRHSEAFYLEMMDLVRRTGGWQGEVWNRHKSGEVCPQWLAISTVFAEDGAVSNYIGRQQDITERKRAEQRIEELAFVDQLTGLPNRALLLDRLKQWMMASDRSGRYCALLFIDLDNFRMLNDTLGHDIGDLLLKEVGLRLKQCVREVDTTARLGGDDFVAILASLSLDENDAAKCAEGIAEIILAALNQPYQLNGIYHHCTASIGVSLFKGTLISTDELMKQADLSMYKAKASGRNTFRFFDSAMGLALNERAALEGDLRHALLEKQFLLHYQAQVVGENRLLGAEVLVRWQHPRRGMVSPADFIPLAEEIGLIEPLGLWVLETACKQLASWATRPEMEHLILSVNVSAHQFSHPDFVIQVITVLTNTGANPQRLKLELTESLLVKNVDAVIEKMFALKAKGVGFSLDDFGTGFSSLSYLKRLPLDQLKIDQSFVRDVLVDPNDAAIARTIVALAQSLGLAVIAEGVETAAQRDFLANSGCHAYQGFFYSRPIPLDEFEIFAQQSFLLTA
jgi:diguanylate cyclase (GGDEF)-like protein/PAS domain S-box-containing protein